MDQIKVYSNNHYTGLLTKENKNYIFNYDDDAKESVSLTMPIRKQSWTNYYHLHPIFEMNLPEGYLYEVFKKLLQKEFGVLDEFILLAILGQKKDQRLYYENNFLKQQFHCDQDFSLESVLQSSDQDLFDKLLQSFLYQSHISGVQPKVLATLKDKTTLNYKDYIIKTWGEEYPNLAENEYFSLCVAKKCGLDVPNFFLSDNKKLLIIEKFDYISNTGIFKAFEEICVLQGKRKDQKYDGSYEQLAKSVYTFASSQYKKDSLLALFKMVVLAFLLRNGDAHLKNFGIIYTNMDDRQLAPVYDIVTTTAYIHQDKPALTMAGKKIWWGKKQLIQYGVDYCQLTKNSAVCVYEQCLKAVKETQEEVSIYIDNNKNFKIIGTKMIKSWESSYIGENKKDISNDLL